MTRIFTTILILIFRLITFGQEIRIDTLFLPITVEHNNLQSDKLKFPIIRTGNLEIDKVISTDLKNRFTNNKFTALSTDSAIIKWADNHVYYLDFEVTYKKNEFISFNINTEGCRAYCSNWTDYFTYNLATGKYVTINEIVDTAGKFKTLVLSDKDKQYEVQKKELRKILLEKDSELDEATYNWALEHYERCDNEFALNSFALHADHLEIIEKCYLPNAIKSFNPEISLKYKYVDIKEHLKITNLE